MAALLCESDWGIGLTFVCCFSLTLRRCNGGSPVHGAMLFISETPPDTFSSRRRSGGVHGTLERAVRGPLAWTVSELSRAQSKDVPDGRKPELCRENNVFLAFLKGHVVVFFFFFWLKTTWQKWEKRRWEKPPLHSLSLYLTEKCHIDYLLGYFVNTSSRTDLAVCPNHSKIQRT